MKSTSFFACSLRLVTAILVVTSASAYAEEARPLYLDPNQPTEKRVEDLLSRLTLEEKISLLHGDSKFTTAAIPRLNIPRRWMSDGPHGVREDIGPDTWNPAGRTDDFATCMPCGIALAATWNPDLARADGVAIGEEALARGKHIMLGPGVNIMRTPLYGRNFEYLGEDPFLAVAHRGRLHPRRAVARRGVVRQTFRRQQSGDATRRDQRRDGRTDVARDLSAGVQGRRAGGRVWAVMGAYNKLRGQYCCHNDYLLNQILKDEWGFRGMVMSDWDGSARHARSGAGRSRSRNGHEQALRRVLSRAAFPRGAAEGRIPDGAAR